MMKNEHIKVLINLSTLKSGGGQNVALNFLHALEYVHVKNTKFFFLVAQDSLIHDLLKSHNMFNFHAVSQNPIKRILFEIFSSGKLLRENKIDIIYSYFGFGLFDKDIPQVSGSADSNLYFPEIDFWEGYHGISRIKKSIIDNYRIWGLKRSNAVIYENKSLELIGRDLFSVKRSVTIKPSINFNFDSISCQFLNNLHNNTPVGLFLCGWQLNKNYMKIPDIALLIKKRNQDFHFVLTAPLDNSKEHLAFMKRLKDLGVEEMVSVIGPVNKSKLKSLYSRIDIVFLLSKLESFSNNIIEAWYFERPLIVADEMWSREICQNAAVFVNRNSVKSIVDAIENMTNQVDKLIMRGKVELEKYPTIEERIVLEMEFVRDVYQNN